MIITQKFVFIHEGKTGGTFVTKALNDLHPSSILARSLIKLFNKVPQNWGEVLPTKALESNLKFRGYYEQAPKHGTCHDIPESQCTKPIVSIVRNPYDRYVSSYYYRWWSRYPQECFTNLDQLYQEYPHFPEVSFEEFVKIANSYRRKLRKFDTPLSDDIGFWSDNFIRFFFRSPETVYPLINQDYINSKYYEADMFDVCFLHTENLNKELWDFLLQMGYPSRKLESILELGKIRPTDEVKHRPDYDWKKYYTPELKAFVRKREGLIFSLFPRYDY
jgi:hypothetical protein